MTESRLRIILPYESCKSNGMKCAKEIASPIKTGKQFLFDGNKSVVAEKMILTMNQNASESNFSVKAATFSR